MSRSVFGTLELLWVLGFGAAQSGAAQNVEVTATATTLITTASGLIGQVSDLLVATDGRVYVADRQASTIHVLEADGRVSGAIGRDGQGPGEFRRPTSLAQKADTLVVVDWFNYRVQYLSLDGAPRTTVRLPRGPSPPVVGPSGLMVSPTIGFANDTALAIVRGSDYSERARIGRTMGLTPNPVSMAALREEIRAGRVPAIYLNMAEVAVSSSEVVWLTVAARGSVERFDAAGRQLSALQLEDPGFEDVRRRFVADNAAATGMEGFALRYILDTHLVGEDLWVLLGQSVTSEAVVRVINRNGTLGPRYTFANVSGVDAFAVDARRRLAYFISPETAELLRVAF
jgi:hypothetical protein